MAQSQQGKPEKSIMGTFYKQRWGGRKDNEAIPCGEEKFDATDAVLLMDLKTIHNLEDFTDTLDELWKNHVQWDGPYDVEIVESICDFFNVSSLPEITQESLDQMRRVMMPLPATEQVVTLSIKVKVSVAARSNMTSFIENLDYSIKSNTSGITVQDTEIVNAI